MHSPTWPLQQRKCLCFGTWKVATTVRLRTCWARHAEWLRSGYTRCAPSSRNSSGSSREANMTQDNRNHPDLDTAINAMRNAEPTPEQIRVSSTRIFHNLQTTAAEAQPEVIRGCDDVVRLLPLYSSGELPVQRALLV